MFGMVAIFIFPVSLSADSNVRLTIRSNVLPEFRMSNPLTEEHGGISQQQQYQGRYPQIAFFCSDGCQRIPNEEIPDNRFKSSKSDVQCRHISSLLRKFVSVK
jgi:hypothetical protein